MNKKKIWIKSILIPLLIGGIIAIFTSGSMEEFKELIKPPLAPPAIVFPIVWTILYVLMGISYARIETKGLMDRKSKMIYYAQLFVNAMWSIIFFVLKWRLFSFFWILLLMILVIIMIIKFYQKDKIAGLLQIPYLVWISFATYLTMGIYLLNK